MNIKKTGLLEGWEELFRRRCTWKKNLINRRNSIDQELDSLKLDLRKYDSKNVAEFISELNSHCFHMAIDLSREKIDKSYIRKQEKLMLKTIKKTIKYLERKYAAIMKSGEIQDLEIYPDRLPKYMTIADSLSRSPEFRCIYNLEKKLEKKLSEKSSDRPPEDGSISKVEFVKEIALLFKKHLDRPTFYVSGPFFTVVCRVLAAVGLPSEDPSRIIKKAFKTIERDGRAPE